MIVDNIECWIARSSSASEFIHHPLKQQLISDIAGRWRCALFYWLSKHAFLNTIAAVRIPIYGEYGRSHQTYPKLCNDCEQLLNADTEFVPTHD